MQYLIVIALGYLLGCSNMATYLAKMKKVDLTAGGSGNPGASNAVILMGWGAGVMTALHDIGKSVLAVIIARILFPSVPYIEAVAGVSCVLGHIFPFWMGFRGGKGFASYIGMSLAMNWKFTLGLIVVLIAVTLITDYIVAATTTTIVVVPIYMAFSVGVLAALILLIASVVIAWKHRDNYVRIYKGTEIGFRSAGRGDHRVK